MREAVEWTEAERARLQKGGSVVAGIDGKRYEILSVGPIYVMLDVGGGQVYSARIDRLDPSTVEGPRQMTLLEFE